MRQPVLPHHAAQRLQQRKLHPQQTETQSLLLPRDEVQQPGHARGSPAVSASPIIGPVEAPGPVIPNVMEKPRPRIAQKPVVPLHLLHRFARVAGGGQEGRQHIAGIRPYLAFMLHVAHHAARGPRRQLQRPAHQRVERAAVPWISRQPPRLGDRLARRARIGDSVKAPHDRRSAVRDAAQDRALRQGDRRLCLPPVEKRLRRDSLLPRIALKREKRKPRFPNLLLS